MRKLKQEDCAGCGKYLSEYWPMILSKGKLYHENCDPDPGSPAVNVEDLRVPEK